jgi:NAD(P)-dependent dehydrogenase (short-subunit alcohol dehydrogenase family)
MDLDGKIALVTGSTDGVGRRVARRLAEQGARVLIHGRDHDRGKQLVDQIQTNGRGSAVFLPADFSSLAEVRRLAESVRQNANHIHLLLNNAGIGSGGAAGRRETSQDGYELRFAVNYLAGFLLTRLLLPLMIAGKPARIVNVSSLGQHPLDFDDVMLTHGYTGGRAYAQSKLAQIMFTFDLARELILRTSRRIVCIRLPTWRQRWCGRVESRRSAVWKKEPKRSSILLCRRNSMVIPANSTTG